MKMVSKLNLTRKWRSKTFDTIVGQEVSVRILKNSLFLDQIFPVYLFSGQRGCGKTTTARVLTAAVNCERLPDFRKDPRLNPVPCLSCASCLAMEQGKHPDFTEIDAASHTGVDNIRQLIETTSFLPALSRKKVYLIDEVHMLSKAAFNALLKILEEPPTAVIFILATTDPHKVIDTVKSRCFQLFFGPPKTDLLLAHLQNVCQAEKIKADSEALSILIREAEGSIRDAMNLLEQVRFIEAHVTVETVERALGYICDSKLINLLSQILEKSDNLPNFLAQLDLGSKNIEFVWRRLCEILKLVLYIKHGVSVEVDATLNLLLIEVANKIDLGSLIKFLNSVLVQEQYLLKTAHKSLALELFFLQYTLDIKKKLNNDQVKDSECSVKNDLACGSAPDLSEITDKLVKTEDIQVAQSQSAWQQMLGLLSGCGDPILNSIFKQAQFEGFAGKEVKISFSDQGLFFKDLILEKKIIWEQYLLQSFGEQAILEISFVARAQNIVDQKPVLPNEAGIVSQNREIINKHLDSNNAVDRTMSGRQIDVADKEKWPLANQILAHFPGQVYEVSNE